MVNNNRIAESPDEQQKYEPVNLTDQLIEQPLVQLCSRGPSFVPTPTSIDWNDLQQSWQVFKRKVRWRTFFHVSGDMSVSPNVNPLEPRVKNRPKNHHAKIPAIEVFLNRIEKDLFDTTRSNYVVIM